MRLLRYQPENEDTWAWAAWRDGEAYLVAIEEPYNDVCWLYHPVRELRMHEDWAEMPEVAEGRVRGRAVPGRLRGVMEDPLAVLTLEVL